MPRRSRRTAAAPDAPAASPPTGNGVAYLDIVGDILRRLVALRIPVDTLDLERLELDIRRDWGGDSPYIAKHGESGRRIVSQRDDRIRADYRRGERVRLLARRFQLTERRIKQILSATRSE